MSSQPDLHQNWLTSSSKVPRSLDEVTTHSRTGVTLSVVPFVCFVLAVSGLTAWGIMYALNRQSLTSASLAIQQQTVQNIIGVVRDYNTPFIYGVQAIEELLRASERQNPGFVNNTANWLGSAFVIAKQFGGGCYCGYPSGQLFGYRSNDNQTVMRIDTTSDGVLVTSHADQFGEAKNAVSRESGFDVTRRNWYTGAQNRGGFSQTDLYSYAGTEDVGFTYSISLPADLSAPTFATGRAPLSVRAGTEAAPVWAVCGVDGKVTALSRRLAARPIGTSGRALVFCLTTAGLFAGASDVTIPSKLNNQPVHFSQINNTILKATMSYLLKNMDMPFSSQSLSGLQPFYNMFAVLDGELRIVSLTLFVSANTTTSFFIFFVTPSSDYFAASDNANVVSLLVIFLCVVPVLAGATALFLHIFLSRPASRLASAMLAISRDLQFDQPSGTISRIQEVETMQRSFSTMQLALKAFGKFTPLEVVRGILRQARRKQDTEVGVEEVVATVQFSDIENFTGISERVSPLLLITALEEYFQCMTSIIETSGGTVGDYIGDAIFSFFGVPLSLGPHHALSAVSAAVMMQERLVVLREDWKRRGLPQFKVRMGINSGFCLAGNVGSRTRLKFTLLGDEINLAARLEGLCKHYGCYLALSDKTFAQPDVEKTFCCRVLDKGQVAVVGKSHVTVVREVLSRRTDATAEQLHLEYLSERMLSELSMRQMTSCEQTLLEMKSLLPSNDVAMRLLLDRVAKYKVNNEKWTDYELLKEK